MRDGGHIKAGELARNGFELELDQVAAGWEYSSLRIVRLGAGGSFTVETGDDEVVVLPLNGACTVTIGDESFDLAGRSDVFAGSTDFVYVPRDAVLEISSVDGGRFAVPGARARRQLPVRYGAAVDVPIEQRGAGRASRLIRNFCGPDSFEADNLISVEVITPDGNWSSYPPHKHDEHSEHEMPLEEVYYFEIADGPTGPGMAYQRVYGTDDRPIDVLAEVRTGDMVLIPHGWHGPSMAAPGYGLYYLNVMAGPGPERAWRICDDPAHAWVRDTWDQQELDPRINGGQ